MFETGQKGPFNWLTQSSLDTFAEGSSSFTLPETQQSQSSLLFNVGSEGPRRLVARRQKAGPGFGQQRLGAGKASTSTTNGAAAGTDGEGFNCFGRKYSYCFVFFAALIQEGWL